MLLSTIITCVTFAVGFVSSISFDLPSQSASESIKNPFCLSVFIGTDVLVSGFVKSSAAVGSRLDLSISDSKGNVAFAKNGVSEEVRFTFRTNAPEPRDYHICFYNGRQNDEVVPRGTSPDAFGKRSIEMVIETGFDMFKKDGTGSSLKPMEEEMSRLEKVMAVMVDELNYMEAREKKMRDTNESTADRVKWFSTLSLFVLLGLGAWQVVYLKQFFQAKKLI